MKEFEIRPRELFNEYLKISKRDIRRFFSCSGSFVEVDCPACKNKNTTPDFKKYGFSYRTCKACSTLFASPRPTEKMIEDFYRLSDSSKFWAERFFPETQDARREKIFRPRAQLVSGLIRRFNVSGPVSLADVGAGFGIFLEEARKTGIFREIFAIEPSPDLARCCKSKGFPVIEKTIENIKKGELQVSVACSFEVFEHLHDPEKFIRSLKAILKPGGLLIFTTLSISGLDLLVLEKNSKSISPPHHINFFSIEGLSRLLKRCGLKEIEISTPGKLDVDIICNTLEEKPDIKVPRFIEYMVNNRDEKTFAQLQDFLQANCLSSHVRVIAQNA